MPDLELSTAEILTSLAVEAKTPTPEKFFYERHSDFTMVYLGDPDTINKITPKRIVACDLDNTLINIKKSYVDAQPVVDPAAKSIVTMASDDKDALLVCITARETPFEDPIQLSTHPLSAISLLEAVAKDTFKLLIFTNGKSKVPPMDYLFSKFALTDRKESCLLDDSIYNLLDCMQAGYTAIPVFADQNPLHVTFLQEFLKAHLNQNKHYQQTLSLFQPKKKAEPEEPDNRLPPSPIFIGV